MAFAQYIPVNAGASTQTVDGTAGLLTAEATVPVTARYAEGFVRTASVVFYRDGSTPTATAGEQADIGDRIILRSREEIEKASFIRAGGTSATIDWQFWTSPGF